MKNTTQSAINSLKQDKIIKREYIRYLNYKLIGAILIASSAYLIYYICCMTFSLKALGAIPIIYSIFFWVPGQALFLAYSYCKRLKSTRIVLSTGQVYKPFYRLIYFAILYACACAPSVIEIMIFKFNEDTRTFKNFSFLKVQFIYAPLLILFMIFVGWFWGTKSPYRENDYMSKADWVILRKDLEAVGLDPNKVPIGAFSTDQIKNMSKADWYHLGIDLELAGYDVRKKQ